MKKKYHSLCTLSFHTPCVSFLVSKGCLSSNSHNSPCNCYFAVAFRLPRGVIQDGNYKGGPSIQPFFQIIHSIQHHTLAFVYFCNFHTILLTIEECQVGEQLPFWTSLLIHFPSSTIRDYCICCSYVVLGSSRIGIAIYKIRVCFFIIFTNIVETCLRSNSHLLLCDTS